MSLVQDDSDCDSEYLFWHSCVGLSENVAVLRKELLTKLKKTEIHFIVWKGSWFWLFTHFGAIKSPRRSRGLFIAPKCVKSQNQLPLHSKMLNSSDCCEGSVSTEDIWIISEKWKWNFKRLPVFQKFASVCSCQWKCMLLLSDLKWYLWTHLRWSTWICFAKPTSLKPTWSLALVLERDLLMQWGNSTKRKANGPRRVSPTNSKLIGCNMEPDLG